MKSIKLFIIYMIIFFNFVLETSDQDNSHSLNFAIQQHKSNQKLNINLAHIKPVKYTNTLYDYLDAWNAVHGYEYNNSKSRPNEIPYALRDGAVPLREFYQVKNFVNNQYKQSLSNSKNKYYLKNSRSQACYYCQIHEANAYAVKLIEHGILIKNNYNPRCKRFNRNAIWNEAMEGTRHENQNYELNKLTDYSKNKVQTQQADNNKPLSLLSELNKNSQEYNPSFQEKRKNIMPIGSPVKSQSSRYIFNEKTAMYEMIDNTSTDAK